MTSRFRGVIAFADEYTETAPGVFEPTTTEKTYSGIVMQDQRSTSGSGDIHQKIRLANRISVISDSMLLSKLSSILYVVYSGEKFTVSSVTHEPPRVIFTLGGPYNE